MIENTIKQLEQKVMNCSMSNKESRARKGAYVDAIVMLKEAQKEVNQTSEVAIDREKDFDDRDEIYCNWYICPSCKSSDVENNDNYCSNCGCKFVWSGDFI